MMKKILIILLVALTCSAACFAQKDSLSLNEQNKYTYFKVGSALPDVSAESLADYLKKNLAGLQSASATKNNMVTAKGGMLVYKKGLITGQEEGRIDYSFTIDFKENKYRLIMGDYNFVPYQRNRYGVFAQVDGVNIPLEKTDVRITAKQLAVYLDKLGAFGIKTNKIVSDFVNKKTSVKAPKEALKKVDTQKW
ncbi:hypothetical protein [Mucilaginibacter terrae]|nr:hypothetical protein [Mucilaginibacter terrae]